MAQGAPKLSCTFELPSWHQPTTLQIGLVGAGCCLHAIKTVCISLARLESGAPLDHLQRETLKSKTGVLAIIDELEKITPLLKEAAAEEVAKGIAAADAKAAARAERRAERERAEQEKAAADTAEDHKVRHCVIQRWCSHSHALESCLLL
jgi:hypothetical protein